ncbi:MAG TPA: PEP-CTERM sorting domain-containing protein [Trichormus sp. M33_DOE_039]|nr:PEP-CTERM sorting domain-containing protein [Trichormus sp. M33_DOE_039]
MKAKNIILSTGLALSAVLGISSTAKAANFTSVFTPDPAVPTEDIFLNSIVQGSFSTSDFIFVEAAQIIKNVDALGPASTDRGLDANAPFDPNETPSAAEIAAYLGNNNLNNIIDAEETGEFELNVFFDDFVGSNPDDQDSLFFWERGGNSQLLVYALDTAGNIIAGSNSVLLDSRTWGYAGFDINTTEVGGAQRVYSQGLKLSQLGLGANTTLAGLKLVANTNFNGPDFKVVAARFGPTVVDVPEPTTIIGLASVAGLALVGRRRIKKSVV